MNDALKEVVSKTTRITDARGRSVDMIDPINQYLVRGHGDIDAESMRRMAEDIEPGVRRRMCWVIPLVLGGVLVTVALMALNSRTGGKLNWNELLERITNPAFFPIGGYLLFILPWTIFEEKRKRKKKVYAVMLGNRRCPHCGYSLQGLAVDPMDGATICPECACAWKLDDPAIEKACGDTCACSLGSRKGRIVLIALVLTGLLAYALVMFRSVL